MRRTRKRITTSTLSPSFSIFELLFNSIFRHQDANGRWLIDWDYESLLSLHSDNNANMRVTRVGFVRYQEGLKSEEEEGLSKALEPFGCVPVFLEESLVTKFYRDFCKVTPTFKDTRFCLCIHVL